MRYLTVILLFLYGCSTAHKTLNQNTNKSESHSFSKTDSSGKVLTDSASVNDSIEWIKINADSSFDKVTEEQISEVIDSNIIHRETKRTIKEKGQKKVEQSSVIIQKDSSGKQVKEHAKVSKVQNKDSSVLTVVKIKEIKRTTLLPWWLWLLLLALVGLVWWKRNSIIDYFI